MTIDGDMDYAASRVQAHYGRRLREIDWRRVETSRTVGQYLDALRGGPLTDWVSSLDPTRDTHAMERELRAAWRRYVESVAEWHPREWQPWVGWLAWLPALSLLAQLARPGPPPVWMSADPAVGPAAQRALEERIAALKGTPLVAFEPAVSGRVAAGVLWRAHWRSLMPLPDPDVRSLLDSLLRVFDAYTRQMATESADSTAARQRLSERLAKLFRAGAGTVVATICHLGLTAFDLERLRGGLINRCLFAPRR